MIRVEISVVVNRPIQMVFAFVTNVENDPLWTEEVVEAKKITEGPIGVGTTFSDVVEIFGRRLENTLEITAYEPNRTATFKSISGPVPYEGIYTFENSNGGTQVTISIEAEPGGFFKLAKPLIGPRLEKQWQTNFANLKNLLETQD
jgi:uncharacterized membrane protein